MEKREKLTVLLAHMEPLIYETLEVSKTPNVRLKPVVKKISIKENKGMSAESVGKIYVLAVTYIVFAATDHYTEEIDKRIPFRNNILHNGIVMYSDEEVDIVYELLVDLIEILMIAKEYMYAEPEANENFLSTQYDCVAVLRKEGVLGAGGETPASRNA